MGREAERASDERMCDMSVAAEDCHYALCGRRTRCLTNASTHTQSSARRTSTLFHMHSYLSVFTGANFACHVMSSYEAFLYSTGLVYTQTTTEEGGVLRPQGLKKRMIQSWYAVHRHVSIHTYLSLATQTGILAGMSSAFGSDVILTND